LIPLDRIRRSLRALKSIDAREISTAFSLLGESLLERGLDAEAQVVHEAVTKLRAIWSERVGASRRKTA
jgi:hypothetical protein